MSGISGHGADDVVSKLYNGTTAVTQVYTSIVAASSGATLVVTGVALKIIRVISLQAVAAGPVNVKWQSSGNDITGLAYFAGNGGYVLPFNSVGWFQSNPGEDLNINLSAATGVGGSLVYVTF